METFWMVWSEGSRNVTYRHSNEESARNEAARLTKAHGGKFYVLQVIACCERNEVTWTPCDKRAQGNFDEDDRDPFAEQEPRLFTNKGGG